MPSWQILPLLALNETADFERKIVTYSASLANLFGVSLESLWSLNLQIVTCRAIGESEEKRFWIETQSLLQIAILFIKNLNFLIKKNYYFVSISSLHKRLHLIRVCAFDELRVDGDTLTETL